jgi:hypothetical protein
MRAFSNHDQPFRIEDPVFIFLGIAKFSQYHRTGGSDLLCRTPAHVDAAPAPFDDDLLARLYFRKPKYDGRRRSGRAGEQGTRDRGSAGQPRHLQEVAPSPRTSFGDRVGRALPHEGFAATVRSGTSTTLRRADPFPPVATRFTSRRSATEITLTSLVPLQPT